MSPIKRCNYKYCKSDYGNDLTQMSVAIQDCMKDNGRVDWLQFPNGTPEGLQDALKDYYNKAHGLDAFVMRPETWSQGWIAAGTLTRAK